MESGSNGSNRLYRPGEGPTTRSEALASICRLKIVGSTLDLPWAALDFDGINVADHQGRRRRHPGFDISMEVDAEESIPYKHDFPVSNDNFGYQDEYLNFDDSPEDESNWSRHYLD